MRNCLKSVGAGSVAALAGALSAQADPFLHWPVDCVPGQTCVIEDYVDIDPGPGSLDYRCGLKTRDGHSGTDISVVTFEAMDSGVAVLAAAGGRVEAVRDGMADQAATAETRADIAGRECGNAVRIRHANGYQTLYCHLKNGSVAVAPGQTVEARAPIAAVGLSGLTNNPHLHLTVIDPGGQTISPFDPQAQAETCAAPGAATVPESLWIDPRPYTRTGYFTAGFSDAVPEFNAVRDGSARRTEIARTDAMVLYVYAFEPEDGDRIDFTILHDGTPIFRDTSVLDAPRDRIFRASGRRAPPEGWPAGAYRGYVLHWRNDRLIATRHADVIVR
nr:M23 family metallopeptidase [Cognatishimia sp. F0-27]